MGLSNGSCRESYPMGLSSSIAEKVIQWVYPMGLSNGFIIWVLSKYHAEKIIQWVYPMGLAEKNFVVLHHHVPVTLTPAIPLIRTFNPDLYTGLLPKVLTTVVT